jgi:hypothetical protein
VIIVRKWSEKYLKWLNEKRLCWIYLQVLKFFRLRFLPQWRLLSFEAESFVFQFAIQKYKDQDVQNFNFACCFIWEWNLVAEIEEERRLMVFENRMLRRIFGSKSDEIPGEWQKLHNKEFYDLYSLPDIMRLIKSRMRWATHWAGMGDRTDAYRVWRGDPRERDHL